MTAIYNDYPFNPLTTLPVDECYNIHLEPIYRPESILTPASASSWPSSSPGSYARSSPSSPSSPLIRNISPNFAAPSNWMDPIMTGTPTTSAFLTPSATAYDHSAYGVDLPYPNLAVSNPTHNPASHVAAADAYGCDLGWQHYTQYQSFATHPIDVTASAAPHNSTVPPPLVQTNYGHKSTSSSSSLVSPTSPGTNGYPCRTENCKARPFKRKADLERHYRHVHLPSAQREAFLCDYPKCTRARTDAPFHRRDHLRDHYREYHKDEIVKRGDVTKCARAVADKRASRNDLLPETEEWRENAIREFSTNCKRDWWRCAKCLKRMNNGVSECKTCKAPRRPSASGKK